MTLSSRIKQHLLTEGARTVGIAEAQPLQQDEARLADWLKNGFHGEMEYMARHQHLRTRPEELLAGARSVVAAAFSYHTGEPSSSDASPNAAGWIARYAWGDDYHTAIKKRLMNTADALRRWQPGAATRVLVDTAPALERAWARQAGLGWVGKNTCTLSEDLGSFYFIGLLLTTAVLDADAPVTNHCGSCSACLDACPTDAFTAPWVLDATRCISYLTIEHRSNVDENLRPKMGRHVFGCDICQDVCPFNRAPPAAILPELSAHKGRVNPPLAALLAMTIDEYRVRFRHSAVKRAKYPMLLRNACLAAGNSGDRSLLPALEKLFAHEDPHVAEAARWAAARLAGS